jgi:hypothetical protein
VTTPVWIEVHESFPARGVKTAFIDMNTVSKIEVFEQTGLSTFYVLWLHVGMTCYTSVEQFKTVADAKKRVLPNTD